MRERERERERERVHGFETTLVLMGVKILASYEF